MVGAQISTTFCKESILHVSHALDYNKLLPRPDSQRLVLPVYVLATT